MLMIMTITMKRKEKKGIEMSKLWAAKVVNNNMRDKRRKYKKEARIVKQTSYPADYTKFDVKENTERTEI